MLRLRAFSQNRVRNAACCRPRLELLENRLTPAVFHVNTLLDTAALSLQNGKDSAGHVSLRSAIMAANARPNSDTIVLPAGTFTLTIAGANEDNAATGDLDIRGNLTIKGEGAGKTVIDANALDRVFEVLGGNVKISGITIQHGSADHGAGLLNLGGHVTLTSDVITNNVAIGMAGANRRVGAGGGLTGQNGGDGGPGAAGEGGGIFNAGGSLSIVNCAIALNQAQGGAADKGEAAATARAPLR